MYMDIIYIDIGQKKTGYHVSSWFHHKPNCTPRNCLFFISIKVRDELIPTLRSFVRELQIILHQQVPLLIGVGNFCPSLAKRHPFAKKKLLKCSNVQQPCFSPLRTDKLLKASEPSGKKANWQSALGACRCWHSSIQRPNHSESRAETLPPALETSSANGRLQRTTMSLKKWRLTSCFQMVSNVWLYTFLDFYFSFSKRCIKTCHSSHMAAERTLPSSGELNHSRTSSSSGPNASTK